MANDLISTKAGTPGVRGISYPAISLSDAVDRARQLWDRERKNPAPIEAIASHWGYSPNSSGVRTTVAALLGFGLVADQGSGAHREIQLTARGLDIVLETPEREAALLEAVTSPKIYAELLANFPQSNLPSDQTLKVYLLRHKNFNPKAVDGFIKDFRDSISFSGLSKAGNMPPVSTVEVTDVPTMQLQQAGRQHGARPDIDSVATAVRAVLPGERQWFEIDLSTEIKCRVLIAGAEVGLDEIDELIDHLERQKRMREKKRVTGVAVIAQAREEGLGRT